MASQVRNKSLMSILFYLPVVIFLFPLLAESRIVAATNLGKSDVADGIPLAKSLTLPVARQKISDSLKQKNIPNNPQTRIEEIRKQLKAKTGGESGGGGSSDRDLFYSILDRVLGKLSTAQSTYVFNTQYRTDEPVTVNVEDLYLALWKTNINPVHVQLYDRYKLPVELYNDPAMGLINFNVENWKARTDFENAKLGLHELMGILTLPDPSYSISTKLAEFAVGSESDQGLGSISVCGVSVTSLSYATDGADPAQVKSEFENEGGIIKTCRIKNGMRPNDPPYFAIIAIFKERAFALLINVSH
jgi:hypothetical protein